MHGYLPHVVWGIPEIHQNGAKMKEYLLIVYVGIYQAGDVEKCGDIVCPLNCFDDGIDALPVDLHGISSDI